MVCLMYLMVLRPAVNKTMHAEVVMLMNWVICDFKKLYNQWHWADIMAFHQKVVSNWTIRFVSQLEDYGY